MRCKDCGCTDDDGCYDEDYEVLCRWTEAGLCSFCATAGEFGAPTSGRQSRSGFPNLERAGFVLP